MAFAIHNIQEAASQQRFQRTTDAFASENASEYAKQLSYKDTDSRIHLPKNTRTTPRCQIRGHIAPFVMLHFCFLTFMVLVRPLRVPNAKVSTVSSNHTPTGYRTVGSHNATRSDDALRVRLSLVQRRVRFDFAAVTNFEHTTEAS